MRDLLVGFFRDRRVVEQLEVRAGAWQRPESRASGELEEQIAFALIKRRQVLRRRILADELGERDLRRRMHGERHKLVHAYHFGDQRLWPNAVADLPSRGVKRLAERADHDGALAQVGIPQQALVTAAVTRAC